MAKKEDNWGKRNPLTRLLQPSQTDSGQTPISALDMIQGQKKKPRGRDWEKHNHPYSYKIPVPLHGAAAQIRKEILSIAQFNPEGNPRSDGTSVDAIAKALMDWALTDVQKNPDILAPRINPHSRGGQMTVSWKNWEGWDKSPVKLKEPVRSQGKKGMQKKFVLSFRWGAEIDASIKELAGAGAGQSKGNPLKFAVPVGDLVVVLLRLAIDGYLARRYTLTTSMAAVIKVDGWESS